MSEVREGCKVLRTEVAGQLSGRNVKAYSVLECSLKAVARSRCPVCDDPGALLYDALNDGLFGTPGTWSLRRCSRNNCGAAWLDPCPTPEDISLAYAQYYTHADGEASRVRVRGLERLWRRLIVRRFKRLRIAAETAYRAVVYRDSSAHAHAPWLHGLYRLWPAHRADTDFSYMYLPVQPGARLLEVGCGSGWLLELMRERGWLARGIDFDDKAVAHARSRGLDVDCGELVAQRYAAGSFDVIVASHLVEHLHEPTRFLAECRRLLKPGGQMVLVTPNIESLGHRIFGRHWRGLEPPRHIQIFTGPSLAAVARAAGFAHCDVRFSIRDAHHLFQASRNLASRGAHRHGELASLWRRFWTRALQYLEFVLMQMRPALGEELVVILR